MAKTKKDKKIQDLIKETAQDLLSKLSITSTLEVVEKKTEEEGDLAGDFLVNITTEETGLLIGRHGETINSLQLILGVIIYNKTNKWYRIVLDVGDYRKSREESIKEMVERIALEVESSGQSVTLPDFTSYERRIVHMLLADNKKVTSESIGEGRDRRLTIKLRG